MQILYALRIRIARHTNHDENFKKKNCRLFSIRFSVAHVSVSLSSVLFYDYGFFFFAQNYNVLFTFYMQCVVCRSTCGMQYARNDGFFFVCSALS